MAESITVASNDRAAVIGMTESGKTFLSRYLLHTASRLVVLDPKGTLRGQWALREWSPETRKLLLAGEPVRVRVAAPLLRGASSASEATALESAYWDAVLWDVYDARNVILYIDEVYGVVPGGRPPAGLKAIYTRGRELGIGAISASQRPAWIPLELLSESKWYFLFRLQLEDDRKRMAGLMGADVLDPITDEHGFWSYKTGWDRPVYTSQLVVKRQKGA